MIDFINSEVGGWAIVIAMLVLMVVFRKRRNRGGSDTGLFDDFCDGDGGD